MGYFENMLTTTKTDIQIIEKIGKLLVWYENNCDKATVLRLIEFQDKLSLLSCNLATITARAKGSHLRAYFERKHTFSIKKLGFIKEGLKIGTAEEQAQTEIEGLTEKEIQTEEIADSLMLELRQVNKVLSAVQQRISFMKTEYETMHKLSHDNKK